MAALTNQHETAKTGGNQADNLCYITMKGHQFVVPVEWITPENTWDEARGSHAKVTRVTKLRCACGKETDR